MKTGDQKIARLKFMEILYGLVAWHIPELLQDASGNRVEVLN